MEHPLKMYHVKKKTFEVHQAWIHNCLCSAKLTEFSYKSYRVSVLLRQKTLIMLKENQRRTAARGRDGGGQAKPAGSSARDS